MCLAEKPSLRSERSIQPHFFTAPTTNTPDASNRNSQVELSGLELHEASTAIAVVPFPFAVVPSYFLPHRRHSSAVMPFSLAVVCPSAVISHPRIIPDLDPLVITNITNLFRSIDKISSNCKCLGAPPWRSKFAVVPFQTC